MLPVAWHGHAFLRRVTVRRDKTNKPQLVEQFDFGRKVCPLGNSADPAVSRCVVCVPPLRCSP